MIGAMKGKTGAQKDRHLPTCHGLKQQRADTRTEQRQTRIETLLSSAPAPAPKATGKICAPAMAWRHSGRRPQWECHACCFTLSGSCPSLFV